MSVAAALASALGNAAGPKAGWRWLGTGVPANSTEWHDAPTMLKMVRLAEHIEWAEKHNALPEVAAFLRGLQEDEWHHLSE
jgi:hypothetical protein